MKENLLRHVVKQGKYIKISWSCWFEEVRLWKYDEHIHHKNCSNLWIRWSGVWGLGFQVDGQESYNRFGDAIETWKSWNVKRTTNFQTSPLNVWSVYLSANIPRSKQILGYEVWSVELVSLIEDMFGWHVWREDLLRFHVKADPPAAIVSSWDELRIKLLGMMDFVDGSNLQYGRHWSEQASFNLKSSPWTVRL